MPSLQKRSSGRSLIKMRKRVGPRTDPWGTPALMECSLEELPLRTTCIERWERNYFIIFRNGPEIPYAWSLWISPRCQTLSNALEISKAMALASPDTSSAWCIRSVITVSKSAVERSLRKPYWWSERSLLVSRCLIKDELITISKTLLIIGKILIGR